MLWTIMIRKAVAMVMLIGFSTFTMVSCASERYQQNKGAVIGGGTGAVAGGAIGGVIGAQSGHTGTGVVIGSLLGALAGAAIGHYAYDQKRTEEAAKQQYAYDYNQQQATLVRVEDAFASPSTIKRGGTIELSTTYTVLGPQGATMEVTETREIHHGGELTGRPQVTVQRQGGTYTSRVPLTLTADAQKGTYTVTASIQSGSSSDSREFTFTVQ
ncbi:MAG: glycine zipper domain-containing protein [Proteobacteria bacterium]|nr:glycine zipper domain-containing protein [Pseudomonadota bacterium]